MKISSSKSNLGRKNSNSSIILQAHLHFPSGKALTNFMTFDTDKIQERLSILHSIRRTYDGNPDDMINAIKLLIFYISLLIDCMGADESRNQQQNQLVQVRLSPQDLAKVQNSANKPSPHYATLASKTPGVLKVVQIAKLKYGVEVQYSKDHTKAEILPMYQMVSSPNIYYKGEWKNGKQHGIGQVFTKNSTYFKGEFVQGAADCRKGLIIFPDGSYYIGSFKDNSFSGKGKYQNPISETIYEGEWRNNKPHGKGRELFKDGSIYKGQFENGKKHGRGVFTWSTGKVYDGQFENGQMHGQGKLQIKQSQSSFEGLFERGLKVKGDLKTKYGTYYGKFVNGLMHDEKARFKWNDGRQYVGGFQYGQMHDKKGTLTFPNGQVIVGRWERGENIKILDLAESQQMQEEG